MPSEDKARRHLYLEVTGTQWWILFRKSCCKGIYINFSADVFSDVDPRIFTDILRFLQSGPNKRPQLAGNSHPPPPRLLFNLHSYSNKD